MKVRNLNNSSVKTRRLIKDTFVKMLTDKDEINNMSISAIAERAEISRATFYSHFDDIFGLVEEYESELINEYFTNAKLQAADNYELFLNELFAFMKKNDENHKAMCKTCDFLFSARKLSELAINKFTELFSNDRSIINRDYIELDIKIFVDGLTCEYIKYCNGLSDVSTSELYDYSKNRLETFINLRRRISE